MTIERVGSQQRNRFEGDYFVDGLEVVPSLKGKPPFGGYPRPQSETHQLLWASIRPACLRSFSRRPHGDRLGVYATSNPASKAFVSTFAALLTFSASRRSTIGFN
jgi:hypothetical protein